MNETNKMLIVVFMGILMFLLGVSVERVETRYKINEIVIKKDTEILEKVLASAQIGYNCANAGYTEDESLSLILTLLKDDER